MHPAKLAAAAACALLLAAGCASTPPPRHTVPGVCRTLRADVLAHSGTPDARTILRLLSQDPGTAGRIHGDHGLTMDLDWELIAVTAHNRDTRAGRRVRRIWLAALAGDCQRAAGVTIPYRR